MSESSQSSRFSVLRGDIAGGLTAAVISFPQAIGYGLLAFAPLGADFTGNAVALGIYSAVLAGFVASLFGSTAIQITGPKVPLTLLVATLVGQLTLEPGVSPAGEFSTPLILGAVSFTVLLAGLFQIALGASGIGSIAKYVPYPVIGGFMNGVALSLIFKQIPLLLGIPNDLSFSVLIDHPETISLWAVLIGAVTLVGIVLAKKFLKRVPAYLVGIAAGTAAHYVLARPDAVMSMGGGIGSFGFQWPGPVDFVRALDAAAAVDFPALLPVLVATGLAIGLVGALESLFSCVVSDNLTGERHSSNRELIGQGIGNLACGFIAALPAAGSIPRSQANFKAGGRTRLSGMLAAALVFLFFWLLGPLIGMVPLPAVAGMLIFVGIDLFDDWTVSLARKLKAQAKQRREVFVDFVVALVVAIITFSVNLIVAVGIGIAAASALFIVRMGNTLVRRRYDGLVVRSRKMRLPEQEDFLAETGRQIVVLELQGPLFFGSGDKLITELDEVSDAMRYLILDMRRVTDIDSTATRLLPQLKALLAKNGRRLLISHLAADRPMWQFLEIMGVVNALGAASFHPTTDGALEWAEDQVLAAANFAPGDYVVIPLARSPLAQDMGEAEVAHLRGQMSDLRYSSGDRIFCEGDRDNTMLLVLHGSVTIRQKSGANGRAKRVFTYGPGSIIGELALIDRQPRSASAWADSEVELLSLSPETLDIIKAQQPELAVKLVSNVARIVSAKLRRASSELAALEDI